MSNLLREKHALAKLRAELEGRKGRICFKCKSFGHLARNCRNLKEEKRKIVPQNKFEILSSRVMQSGERGRTIRRMEAVVVECFKCGEKCRECSLWEKKEKRVACPVKGKVHQKERRPAH